MRPVRPTLRALLRLPRDSFEDPAAYDAATRLRGASSAEAKAQIVSSLRLNKISHPLLADAQSYFDGGILPGQHKASSQKRGKPVYEVRSYVGAGWRGGVIIDDDGDPWLVYVDKHDEFHATAPAFFAKNESDYLPTSVDRRIRQREEVAAAEEASDVACLGVLVETITAAVERSPEALKATVTGLSGSYADLTVMIELGTPADGPETAHTSISDVNLDIRIDASDQVLRSQLLRLYLPFVQPDERMRDQAYRTHDTIQLIMTVSHAQLAQLLVTGETGEAPKPPNPLTPTVRHYVPQDELVGAFVRGEPMLALCRTWFVPTRDGETATDLPICNDCERTQPVAQHLLDQARRILDQS